jgi:hypothetical protein
MDTEAGSSLTTSMEVFRTLEGGFANPPVQTTIAVDAWHLETPWASKSAEIFPHTTAPPLSKPRQTSGEHHLELVTATFSTFCVARCHHIYGYDPASRCNWQKMACIQIFHQVRTTTLVACIRFIGKAINGP